MKTNLLKLNDSKTEFMIVGTRQQLELAGELSIRIGNDTIKPTPLYEISGIFYDSQLKNNIHVNKLASSLVYHS